LDLKLRGLPLSDLEAYPQEVAAVNAMDVREAAQDYVRPDEVAIVVVGDASQIEDDLETVAPVTLVADPLTADAD